MKKIYSFLLCSLSYLMAEAQTLHPSIGIGSLPADADTICTIPWYLGSFSASGLQKGDTAADFTLYDTSGAAFNLSAALALKKPVLLVSASLTCPVFRNKINSINSVLSTYGSQVTTAVIYCVEAHPTDTSPYFGYVNVTTANQNAGILYPQPTTYGQRKQMVKDLYALTPLAASTYIDGPCNNWWLYYGPAPNNAYLIDTNGIVAAKHPWYDSYPDDIFCDIDSVLGITGNCNSSSNNGNFNLQMTSNDTVWDLPGNTLSIDANLVNNSSSNVLIKLERLQNNMPTGWASSMCATVCYSTSTDSVTISVPAMSTQQFHFYFYTDTTPNIGHGRIRFMNVNNTANSFVRNFYGVTSTTSIKEYSLLGNKLRVYPVPAFDELNLEADLKIKWAEVYDISGRPVLRVYDKKLSVASLPDGYYFVKAFDEKGNCGMGKFVKLAR